MKYNKQNFKRLLKDKIKSESTSINFGRPTAYKRILEKVIRDKYKSIKKPQAYMYDYINLYQREVD